MSYLGGSSPSFPSVSGWGIPPSGAQEFAWGAQAEQAGRYADAAGWYSQAGNLGHMEAQHRVGLLYKDGRGVPRDPFTAHRWFGSAALAGHALAQCAVGTQYFMGEGVALDYSAAMLHFRMAAEQGNAFGQYSLGVCYERGLGVPRGVDEALRLYRLSSRNGCVEATERLVRLEERSRREQTMVREEQERAIRQSEQRLSQINEQQRILDQVSQSLRSTHLSDTRPEAAASQGSNATLFSTHSSPPESYRSMSTFAERAEAPSVSMIARGTDLETERPDATSVSITARGTDFEGEDARPEPKEERQRHVPRPKHWIEERDVEIDKSSPLDKGGFGQVYRGKHLKRHDVAIKVYLENRTEQQIKTAFEAEIAIWGDIPSSDYVVPLIGYHVDPTFIVMKLYKGGSMYKFLASRNWDQNLSLRLLKDAAVGMEFLHSKNIVHHDLKAQNILVDDSTSPPTGKVADFGLSKVRKRILDSLGKSMYEYDGLGGYATLRFAPPEHFDPNERMGRAADVWTFGMMCYQVMSKGKQPYEHMPDNGFLLGKIITEGRKPPRPYGIPQDLWSLMLQCWNLEAGRRPPMRDVADVLEAIVASLPPYVAEPPSSLSPTLKNSLEIQPRNLEKGAHLGSGAFGEVSRGKYLKHTDVAMKSIKMAGNEKTLKKKMLEFEKEMEVWGLLPAHDNVLPLIGWCKDPLCMVTRFMPNGTAPEYLRKMGWNRKATVKLLFEVANGMNHLHNRPTPIVHSDLKGANVLVDEYGTAKVADFGLTTIRREASKKSNFVGGTPVYMAPEVWASGIRGEASDVYAFGMTMWELWSQGDMPLEDQFSSVDELRERIKREPDLRPGPPDRCPPAIWNLMTRCWALQASDRPRFQAIADELKSVLESGVIRGFGEFVVFIV